MVNAPAAISFFCIIVVLIMATTWKRYRKSKVQVQVHAEDHSDVESHSLDKDNENERGRGFSDEEEGKPKKYHVRNWRWKRILRRVGWIRILSVSETEDEQEMRNNMERREAAGVGDQECDQAGISEDCIAKNPESGVRSKFALVNRLERPADVPSFEKVGGYRYGDFGYGPDNMSPLPVRISTSPAPYGHPQGIAEVEGMSIASGSLSFSPVPSVSAKTSMDSGYGSGFPLTSHNGFRNSSQDDIMAALPIPKDHPLSQHRLVGHRPATRKLSKPGPRISLLSDEVGLHEIERKLEEEDDILLKEEQILEGERNLKEEERILSECKLQEERRDSPFQYERQSLVPAPLNRWRGRHSPANRHSASRRRSQISTPETQQSDFAEVEGPHPVPPRCVSAFGSTSSTTSESRYSHFENPLRQHPVELEDIVRKPEDIMLPVAAQAAKSQAAKSEAAEKEWPFARRTRRKRYTWVIEPTQILPPVDSNSGGTVTPELCIG